MACEQARMSEVTLTVGVRYSTIILYGAHAGQEPETCMECVKRAPYDIFFVSDLIDGELLDRDETFDHEPTLEELGALAGKALQERIEDEKTRKALR